VRRSWTARVGIAAAIGLLGGCASSGTAGSPGFASSPVSTPPLPTAADEVVEAVPDMIRNALPGMPRPSDPNNVYAAAGAGMFGAAARAAKPLVYVPHNSGEVWVIDPETFAVVRRFPAGIEVQHVVPSYDMQTLYATDDVGNTVTPIDPRTGIPGPRIPVDDPYNMYSTPDGTAMISVAEDRKALIFLEPQTLREQSRLQIPLCDGLDHADYSADGRLGVFTCEFAGRVAVVDMASRTLVRMLDMPVRNTHMGPQDIRLAPDGSRFYVADHDQGGLWVIDGAGNGVIGQIPTGPGAHGLYFSRDGNRLFVSNRLNSTISVLDSRTGTPVTKWAIPRSSPDMGGVSADGTQLWLSGRYSREIYVISTVDGSLIKRIPVGDHPHGICVWPQPGRWAIGHTGNTR
jgi:YVTN family beta-propeller protein